MTEKEFYKMLKESNFPAAYHHFEEGKSPEPPFLIYLFPSTNNFAADGNIYKSVNQLDIELYTDKKDLKSEKKIEKILKENGIFFQKTESFIETEKLYEVLYETEVLIDE